MRDYELLYVVSGAKTEEETNKVTDEVNGGLMKLGGKVDHENDWGRRRLAYPIAKQDHGWYVVARFSIDPTKLVDLQNTLRLNQSVIRHLVIQAAEVPTEEEAEKAREAVSASQAKSEEQAEAKAEKAKASAAPKPEPKKPETAAEAKERKAKLEEVLGEKLKES